MQKTLLFQDFEPQKRTCAKLMPPLETARPPFKNLTKHHALPKKIQNLIHPLRLLRGQSVVPRGPLLFHRRRRPTAHHVPQGRAARQVPIQGAAPVQLQQERGGRAGI